MRQRGLNGMSGCWEWIWRVESFLNRNGCGVFVVNGVVCRVIGEELGVGSRRW